MALSITDSQGTLVYVCAGTGTSFIDAAAFTTAIGAAKQIGCLQDLGSITSSRNVQEYSCLSSDEIAKSLGSLTLGNMQISLLFNSQDVAGQSELRNMFENKVRKDMIIVLNDDAGTNPTYITFEAAVSGMEIAVQKDNAVMINITVEFGSKPVIFDAAA